MVANLSEDIIIFHLRSHFCLTLRTLKMSLMITIVMLRCVTIAVAGVAIVAQWIVVLLYESNIYIAPHQEQTNRAVR